MVRLRRDRVAIGRVSLRSALITHLPLKDLRRCESAARLQQPPVQAIPDPYISGLSDRLTEGHFRLELYRNGMRKPTPYLTATGGRHSTVVKVEQMHPSHQIVTSRP